MQPCRKNHSGQPCNSELEISGISDTDLSFDLPLGENTDRHVNKLPVTDKCTATGSYININRHSAYFIETIHCLIALYLLRIFKIT